MAEATFSLDLHVLGPPLTFALSQDQTLHRKFWIPLYVGRYGASRRRHRDQRGMGSLLTRNPQTSNLACYSVFRDRSPSESPSPGVSDFPFGPRRVRRGSVLIRGAGLSVNAVRASLCESGLFLADRGRFLANYFVISNSYIAKFWRWADDFFPRISARASGRVLATEPGPSRKNQKY